jgi:hypothetical protein
MWDIIINQIYRELCRNYLAAALAQKALLHSQ